MIGAFVRNPVFANLAAVGILAAGVVSVKSLPKETFPETSVDHIVISVDYPGSSPQDAEQGVCIRIEQAVQGLAGTQEISSISEENSCKVIVEVDTSFRPVADVLREAQDRVNAITTFPPNAERPVLVEAIIRSEVISVGVYGDVPEASIKDVAEQIRRDLIAYRGISQVVLSGVREYEVSIKVTEEALRRFGLSFQQVIDAVKRSSFDLPAGTIRTAFEEINVRTLGQRYRAREFEDLVVIARASGETVRLGQIAEVRDAFEETPVFGRINGIPGVRINVSKTGNEDISRIAEAVRNYVSDANRDLPQGIQLAVWADASRDVEARLNMLIVNGLLGIALVVISLLVFLELRSALVVAVGIPVAYAGALVVTYWTGNTLNMITLLALLMSTGIIVDDAIVIAESIRNRAREKMTPELAAIEGTRRVALPVLLSSATTIVAFLPLMYVHGVMGKLIYALPVVVIAGIVASGIEAFLILPAHLREWNAGSEVNIKRWRVELRHRIDACVDRVIREKYRPTLERVLARRFIFLCGCVAIVTLCVGLMLGGRISFVLWPKTDGNSLLARVRFPEGTPADVSAESVRRLEGAARSLNDNETLNTASPGELVQNMYSLVGEWAGFVPKRGSALCEVSLELMPAERRRVDSSEIIKAWKDAVGPVHGAELFTITRQELGPSEKPLEIRLLGEDLEELRNAADELESKLAQYDGVFDVDDDLIPGKRELQVSLRPGAAALGLTLSDLAHQLRQGLFGGEAVRLQRGTHEIKAMVSYQDRDRHSLSAVENLRIRTQDGAEIPFNEVAETKLIRGFSSIGRQDGLRRVRVQADVDERYANAETIIQDLAGSYLEELDAKYSGVTYLIDGQRARIQESLSSLSQGAMIAFVVIFALLSLPLRSYFQPLVIMIAIPLGLVGAVLGHAMLGYDVTLVSVFGMVALAGIVINDALVLVDRINQNIRGGMRVVESVVDAGQSRFRAVVLTTITTVLGLMPFLLERSSQAQSLIPMAISLAFGLLFSTILTLFVVPSLFLALNDAKRFVAWLRKGGDYPRPESVEAGSTEVPRGSGESIAAI